MDRKKKTRTLNMLAGRLHWTTRRRRLGLFWMASIFGLMLSWLPGFSSNSNLSCSVNSAYDGDTMRLTCDGKRMQVRLYCIDAPEMKQRPWGKESRDYLRSITPERVTVIVHGKDRYGRTIGEVITDDEDRGNLNLAMVLAGQAVVYPKYCNNREYYKAQVLANGKGSGVWEKQGLQQSPWDWRKSH